MAEKFQERKTTTAIFIHCSATKPSMDIGATEIRKWHRNQGWVDIGYHYVIRRNGNIETGRPDNVAGAHVQGWNSRSVGICLVGGVSQEDANKPEANFTDSQMKSLGELLTRLKKKYPDAKIKAHHDVANKACPSFNVSLWLATGELKTSTTG